jgi:large subunit ribosomal protein L25
MATATESNVVQATPRVARNKNEARRVRRSGMVPATLYGAGKEPVSVSVEPKAIAHILHSAAGYNTIFDLQLDGENTKAMIVDWQNDPIRGALLHLDLKRIAMDKMLTVSVPIVLKGVPEGVKTQGGILEQVLREVELECLPSDIPSNIEVDVSALVFGQVLRVSELPHGGKLHFLSNEEQPVAHITAVKEVVEAVAPVEGEVPAEGAEAAPAEPEVIKKGKQETTEGAAEAAKPEKAEKKAEKPEKKEKK